MMAICWLSWSTTTTTTTTTTTAAAAANTSIAATITTFADVYVISVADIATKHIICSISVVYI